MEKTVVANLAVTEWVSPIVFVPKRKGSLRVCVDYRRLNAGTVRDSFPILRMSECIDSLGKAKIMSTLDTTPGYWQIKVDEKDVDKTTFVAHNGLHKYNRMSLD